MENSKVEIKKRAKILKYSLIIENNLSYLVAFLLDIENFDNSYSFGNGSSSLSFNQKVNLLLDTKSLSKEDKIKLTYFMNIRNQFMHNIDANTYVECTKNIDGLLAGLKKNYKSIFDNNNDIEIALEKVVEELFRDCLRSFVEFKGGLNAKLQAIADERVKKVDDKTYYLLQDKIKSFYNIIEESGKQTYSKKEILQICKRLKLEFGSKVLEIIKNSE